MNEPEGHQRRQDGLLTTVFTSYRGLATIAIVFLAGIIFETKLGEVVRLPTQAKRNEAAIDTLKAVDREIKRDLTDIKISQNNTHEILLDIVCNEPETAVNRRECRNR